mmetsp:Transcript_32055/g.75569  ORF Transcript_32055/g.75569 Transcript_32055/m.75569 type:complete len:208 (-) Transcript_32055:839-1462(-)
MVDEVREHVQRLRRLVLRHRVPGPLNGREPEVAFACSVDVAFGVASHLVVDHPRPPCLRDPELTLRRAHGVDPGLRARVGHAHVMVAREDESAVASSDEGLVDGEHGGHVVGVLDPARAQLPRACRLDRRCAHCLPHVWAVKPGHGGRVVDAGDVPVRESVFVRELRPVLHRPRLHDGAHGPGTPDRDRRQRSLRPCLGAWGVVAGF